MAAELSTPVAGALAYAFAPFAASVADAAAPFVAWRRHFHFVSRVVDVLSLAAAEVADVLFLAARTAFLDLADTSGPLSNFRC